MAKVALLVNDADGKPHILLVSAIKDVQYEKGTPAVPAKPAVEAVEANPGRPSNGPGDPGEPPTPAVEAQEATPAEPAVPDKVTVDGVVLNMTAQAFTDLLNS
jgi:hypothetical protein